MSQDGCSLLSSTKTRRALVASKAPRRRYDFDKPANITDLYGN